MPRRARLLVPGVAIHVVQRGNNRLPCFFAEKDYRFYLGQLTRQAEKHGCAIHAYCLMTNHVHLLLTPETLESAGSLMKALGERYVQYVNRTYQRTGTLWEGRFRSGLVQNDGHVLACYRYIELNPVRAGMVGHPGEYRWSSYRVNAQGESSDLVKPHALYAAMHAKMRNRLEAYRELFSDQLEQGLVDDIRLATRGNFVIGHPQFVAEIEKAVGRRVTRKNR